MVTDDFVQRLTKILDHTGMNAATFADKISIQRSSISHLLSGRNKPSLDFILKILENFPEFNLYWILTGKGSLLFEVNAAAEPTPPPSHSTKETAFKHVKSHGNSNIEKMIIIYNDGTFSEHFPR